MEPRNSGISAKSRELTKTSKIPRNSLKILPNTCRYNIFETYLGCWSCFLAVNLQIYLEISSLPPVNNVPKLPGTGHNVKSFAIGAFLERIVVGIANDDLCTKDTIKEKTFR